MEQHVTKMVQNGKLSRKLSSSLAPEVVKCRPSLQAAKLPQLIQLSIGSQRMTHKYNDSRKLFDRNRIISFVYDSTRCPKTMVNSFKNHKNAKIRLKLGTLCLRSSRKNRLRISGICGSLLPWLLNRQH
ncbi:hypothetical protein KIN20_033294 [Parelaphostrongylus tenuis]|uniref:Uncharacterized protein n=1 Tax=Parelaphostrongylus tenuis TaxID=148309 RepID=A0AAD5R7R0_PARTN|nr:hypothetical protein KIN20_033294 [Parelaphostrongylus tenuis]